MAMSVQEISDRFEIQDLLVDYAHAIDTHDWEALDRVFTPDADIDYSAVGGAKGKYPEIKEFLAASLPMFGVTQHMVSNMRVRLSGDAATGRIMLFNPSVLEIEGEKKIFFLGLWYADKYVRTAEGWRIAERIEETGWGYNIPESLHSILGKLAAT